MFLGHTNDGDGGNAGNLEIILGRNMICLRDALSVAGIFQKFAKHSST